MYKKKTLRNLKEKHLINRHSVHPIYTQNVYNEPNFVCNLILKILTNSCTHAQCLKYSFL